jgi:hypothetical protein
MPSSVTQQRLVSTFTPRSPLSAHDSSALSDATSRPQMPGAAQHSEPSQTSGKASGQDTTPRSRTPRHGEDRDPATHSALSLVNKPDRHSFKLHEGTQQAGAAPYGPQLAFSPANQSPQGDAGDLTFQSTHHSPAPGAADAHDDSSEVARREDTLADASKPNGYAYGSATTTPSHMPSAHHAPSGSSPRFMCVADAPNPYATYKPAPAAQNDSLCSGRHVDTLPGAAPGTDCRVDTDTVPAVSEGGSPPHSADAGHVGANPTSGDAMTEQNPCSVFGSADAPGAQDPYAAFAAGVSPDDGAALCARDEAGHADGTASYGEEYQYGALSVCHIGLHGPCRFASHSSL